MAISQLSVFPRPHDNEPKYELRDLLPDAYLQVLQEKVPLM